jgi:DNA-binding Lrp family transcriptional regulator
VKGSYVTGGFARSAPSVEGVNPLVTPASRPLASTLEALVRVRLVGGAEHEQFEKRLRADLAVVDAWRLAGDCDYEVRLVCRTLADLDAAIGELRDAAGHTATTLVLHRVDLEEL